jgi:hypothetical protein
LYGAFDLVADSGDAGGEGGGGAVYSSGLGLAVRVVRAAGAAGGLRESAAFGGDVRVDGAGGVWVAGADGAEHPPAGVAWSGCRIGTDGEVMKRFALLPLLLVFAACRSSNDGFIDNSAQECGPGQDVEISVGIDPPKSPSERFENRLTVLVEVANNSHEEITVKSIRIDPEIGNTNTGTRYDFQSAVKEVDESIPEGESARFELQMTGQLRISMDAESQRQHVTGVDVAVTVLLANGDHYRCRYQLPVPI